MSFSPGSEPVELKDLNVLIGANGAGKSNFIDALAMIRSMSRQPIEPVIEGGGADAWIWKGSPKCDEATVDVVFENVPSTRYPLRHIFSFRESAAGFVICDERVEYEKPRDDRYDVPFFFYKYGCGNPVLSVKKLVKTVFLSVSCDMKIWIRKSQSWLSAKIPMHTLRLRHWQRGMTIFAYTGTGPSAAR